MHVVVYPVNRRMQRRMYLPSERMVVNGVGLGAVDGFNIGKMFTRMFTFKPSSFKFSNIMGAIGSVVSNVGTFGMASAIAPKTFGAHSTTMKQVGMGVAAAAAAAGAYYGGSALMKTAAGGLLKSAGTAIIDNASGLLKTGAGLFSGGGGGGGGGGMTQAQYDEQQRQAYIAQQQAAYAAQQQQAAYDEQLRQAQQSGGVETQLTPTMYPTMDSGPMPGSNGPFPQDMQLQSPYSPLADDTVNQYIDPTTGLITDPTTGNKIDPATGQVVQAGMLPQLSTQTWLMIGGATLIGWYLMSGSKSTN